MLEVNSAPPYATERGRVTERHLDVMKLIAEGHKDSTIARRLGISVITVRRRANRFRFLVDARNRPHAVAIAVALGWIDLPNDSEGSR